MPVVMTTSFSERIKESLAPVVGNYTGISIDRGEGCFLISTDGQKYLDFSSGVGVASTGHCHPSVVQSVTHQVSQLIHACQGVVYYEPHVKLAEELIKITNDKLDSVFFTQSGTDAVEAAMKLVQYVTDKPKLLAFQGGFHGRTLGALSLTTSKMIYRDGYSPLREHEFFPFPNPYRSPWELNGQSFDNVAIQELDSFFDNLPSDIGGVIIEPVLGEGGYIPAPISFLKRLRALCSENKVLLIFDEIQTGVGRTGHWFNYQKIDVQPDALIFAKGIASGMPLGGIIASRDIMSQWKPGAHGGTYNGNPVSTAAGLATLDVLREFVPSVTTLGEYAVSSLKDKLIDCSAVGDIRSSGLMIGIEFVSDLDSKTPDSDRVKTIMKRCVEKQLIIINCGIYENVIRLIPPLVVSKDELDLGIERLVEAIHETC